MSILEAKEAGNNLLKEGQLEEAIAEYSKAIEQCGNAAEHAKDGAVCYANRSLALTKLARFDEALADAIEALKLDPTYAKAHHRQGKALEGLGRSEEAKQALRQAKRVETQQGETKPDVLVDADWARILKDNGLGECKECGQLEGADALLYKALHLRLKASRMDATKTELQNELQGQANAHLLQALELDPQHKAVLNNLGYMHEKGEGVEQDAAYAAVLYQKSAEQGCADAQLNLGMLLFMGNGVVRDATEAGEWMKKAACQGHAQAQRVCSQLGL